jgi:hypothetical protein
LAYSIFGSIILGICIFFLLKYINYYINNYKIIKYGGEDYKLILDSNKIYDRNGDEVQNNLLICKIEKEYFKQTKNMANNKYYCDEEDMTQIYDNERNKYYNRNAFYKNVLFENDDNKYLPQHSDDDDDNIPANWSNIYPEGKVPSLDNIF